MDGLAQATVRMLLGCPEMVDRIHTVNHGILVGPFYNRHPGALSKTPFTGLYNE
jgi:hypothetical protein